MLRRLGDLQPLALTLLSVIGVVAAVGGIVWALDLAPPRALTIAAGRAGGGYHTIAERYRGILAEDGIRLTILETAGSVENARRLAAGEADVALIQGGVPVPEEAGVEALAAVFLEPFFVFHRGEITDAADPTTWGDLRVAVGEAGSGTRAAMEEAIRVLGLTLKSGALRPIGGSAAAEALLAREVDVAVFVAPVNAPYLQPLLRDPDILIAPIRDSEALARRLSYVRMVDIPPAAIDYPLRLPPERVELTAMVAALVAREDLHPALVDRLVRAAERIHATPSLVDSGRSFPNAHGLELPMNPQALALLREGPGALDEVLPYWIGAQVNRIALLLVPILVLALPLVRVLPGLYAWRMRARVYCRYDELIAIDRESTKATTPERRRALIARLDEIDAEAQRIKVPASYRERAYALRLHIDLVRQRLRAMEAMEKTAPT